MRKMAIINTLIVHTECDDPVPIPFMESLYPPGSANESQIHTTVTTVVTHKHIIYIHRIVIVGSSSCLPHCLVLLIHT